MVEQEPITAKIKNKVVNIGKVDVIEEEGYGVSEVWDAKNYDKLMDIMHDIRKGDIGLFRDWITQSVDRDKPLLDVQPKTVSIDHNVITHQGISLTNKNITGQDMTRFLYIFSGTDNSEAPTIHSDHIPNENARMSILDTGFFFAAGTALFQGCVFPTTIENATVKAFGSATHADPTVTGYTVFWINRILDNSKFVVHEKNKTVYSHLHIIDRRSRLSE